MNRLYWGTSRVNFRMPSTLCTFNEDIMTWARITDPLYGESAGEFPTQRTSDVELWLRTGGYTHLLHMLTEFEMIMDVNADCWRKEHFLMHITRGSQNTTWQIRMALCNIGNWSMQLRRFCFILFALLNDRLIVGHLTRTHGTYRPFDNNLGRSLCIRFIYLLCQPRFSWTIIRTIPKLGVSCALTVVLQWERDDFVSNLGS